MKLKEKPSQKTFKMVKPQKAKLKMVKKTKFKLAKTKKKIDMKKLKVDKLMPSDHEVLNGENTSKPKNGFTNNKKTKKAMCKKMKDKKNTSGEGVGGNTNLNIDLKNKGKKILKKKKNQNEVPMENKKNMKNEESEDSEPDLNEDIVKKHKEELHGLKTTDPEFYNYLKEHDKELLNFNASSSDEEKEDMEVCHTAPDSLEVASDESDFEPEPGIPIKRSERSITMAMVKSWQEKLPKTRSKKLLRDVIDAFHAAIIRISTDDDDTFRFKIEGGPVFNAVIRLCVLDLRSGLKSFLALDESTRTPVSKSRNWVKARGLLKAYFHDLTKLAGVSSTSILTVLLKHIHQMTQFLVYFPKITMKMMKRLIDLWSKSEDVVRILAFLCALRITHRNHSLLSSTLKKMYLTYTRNTKFVSPNTLPEINFMRQSLSEMFALDDTVSYQMAFIYIRQLAVHLRNAVTLKKKEHFQAVYSWRYISSLHLWSEVFGLVPEGSPLRSLVYPLVQIIIGTIKLIPSSQYYPLRFHCCQILINISSKCGVFIPTLPFLLEVLRDFDFNRDHKKLSMKPMDLTCLLRCSKLQMKENAFKDALIENVNRLLIEYIATECYRISFPDIIVPAVLQIKQFLKNCKVMNYTKLMKALLDKIMENSKYIEEERKKLNFKLSDTKGIQAIEMGIKVKGTPFLNYYNSWKKIYMQQQARIVVDNVKIGDYKLPVIYKLDKKRSREQSRVTGPPELFPSDDEKSDISFGEEGDSEVEEKESTEKQMKSKNRNDAETPVVKSKLLKKTKRKKRKLQGSKEYLDTEKKDFVEDLQLTDSD